MLLFYASEFLMRISNVDILRMNLFLNVDHKDAEVVTFW